MAATLALLPQLVSAAILPPITLAWNQNPESDIAGYEVKYGTVNGGTYGTTVSAGNSTTTQVSGLSEGVTYYFVVVAYNTAGLRSDDHDVRGVIGPLPDRSEELSASGDLVEEYQQRLQAGSATVEGLGPGSSGSSSPPMIA